MRIHDPSSFHVGDKIAMTDIFLYLWKKHIDLAHKWRCSCFAVDIRYLQEHFLRCMYVH
jgi:hypothetical protein